MRKAGMLVTVMVMFAAQSVFAHLDTLTQAVQHDKKVASYEAEALKALGNTKTVDDPRATGGKAVVLMGENAGFEFDFDTLPVGMHAVYLCAKARESDFVRAVEDKGRLASSGAIQRKPLYIHLRINCGPGGAVEEYRMRVPFSTKYEYMTKIYFHTPEERNYSGKIFIGPRSRVPELTVDRVEVRNPLGELAFRPVKEKTILYIPKERRQMLVSAAQERKIPNPLRAQPLGDEQRRKLDSVLWESVMPLNANPAQIYGSIYRGNPMLSDLVKKQAEKLGKELGDWKADTGRRQHYDRPWRIVNEKLGLEYTLEDYKLGKTLPKPWPFPEDKGAFFFDKDEWGIEASFNYGVIPAAMQTRYHCILATLGATGQGHTNEPNLPDRYFLLGDLEAAADASLLLAAYAYRYPAYDWNMHAMINIAPKSRTFNPGNVFGRGCSYQGWSTKEIIGVVRAYDKLFPYIKGNEKLAARVGRFVPWVKTSDDVVKLIDTFLVQRAAQDAIQHILYPPILPVAATILGPNDVSEGFLNTYFNKIYLRDTLCGLPDLMVGGSSRDGTNYIGSSFYVIGESMGEIFNNADLLERYVRAGGNRKFNIADPRQYPRLVATADTLLGVNTAGGFRPGTGDVNDPMYLPLHWLKLYEDKAGEFLLRSYRWSRSPKIAWVLVNRIGQGTVEDREWAGIVKHAATVKSPILHCESEVLEGYGDVLLEEGVDATDLRHKNSIHMHYGVGSGHAHSDTLDLEVFALGLRMSGDLGGRSSGKYGRPNCMKTYVHNLVEVDGKSFNGGTAQNATAIGWIEAYKPNRGAQFVLGSAKAESHPQVSLYSRGAAQVMSDFGDGEDRYPSAYVFDVFRVAGGSVHTWCFHGCVSEAFETNAGLKPAASELAKEYLKDHLDGTEFEGTAPDVLEATWTMRRTEEEVDGIPLKNAEKNMLRENYDPSSPRKYTKVSLFGQEGAKVMAANWYARSARKHNFPMFYARKEGEEGLESVFVSIIEPYAGKSHVMGKRLLKVEEAGTGAAKAVAMEVKTTFGQTDLLFSAADGKGVYAVEGGARASGRFGIISKDADGLRLLHLVGGTEMSQGNAGVKVGAPGYSTTLAHVNYRDTGRIRLADGLPEKYLQNEMLLIGNELHKSAYAVDEIKGKNVSLERTSKTFRAGIESIAEDGTYAVLDLAPYLAGYHPDYYNGMTIANEADQPVGRLHLKLGERFWFTGWPEARRHLAKIEPGDITDENGDGKRTLTMICNTPVKKFAEDGKTVVTLKPGDEMMELEVTRVRKDGFMFWTRQHPRDYLDSLNITHPGWPYHQQIVRNEKGDKEWIVNMPGDTYQVVVDGKKLTEKDFPDSDQDGRRLVTFHHYGKGDALSAPTHVHLLRIAPNLYELRANISPEITLPGSKGSISTDGGKTWKELPGKKNGKVVTVVVPDDVLGGAEPVWLRIE